MKKILKVDVGGRYMAGNEGVHDLLVSVFSYRLICVLAIANKTPDHAVK